MAYQENNENLDIQIQLLNEQRVYELGDTASYTITITNIGDSTLSDIETHLLTDSTNTIIDTESTLSVENYYTVNGSYTITDDDVKNGSHTLTIFFAYTKSNVDYCTKMYEMVINTNPNDPYTMYAFNTLDELGDNQIAEFRDVSALHNSNNIGDALIGYMTDTSPITTIDQFITKYFGNRIVKIKTFFADLLSALNNALTTSKTWVSLGTQTTTPNTPIQIPDQYNEIYVCCLLESYQIVFNFPIVNGNTTIRQDSGYYYLASNFGSGGAHVSGHTLRVFQPYRNGSATTYTGITVYAR